jgi:hypothetical protein
MQPTILPRSIAASWKHTPYTPLPLPKRIARSLRLSARVYDAQEVKLANLQKHPEQRQLTHSKSHFVSRPESLSLLTVFRDSIHGALLNETRLARFIRSLVPRLQQGKLAMETKDLTWRPALSGLASAKNASTSSR